MAVEAIIRLLMPDDAYRLINGLANLSAISRSRRFFFDKRTFTSQELHDFTNCNYDHLALVAAVITSPEAEPEPVAVARCIRRKDDHSTGELAVTVEDAWQMRGIGTLLLRSLSPAVQGIGICRWHAVFTKDNIGIRKLLFKMGTVEGEELIYGNICEVFLRLT